MKLAEDKPRLRRLYLALVAKAQERNGKPSVLSNTKAGYENHHITPTAWGGVDHRHNLVRFSYREHYVAHLILSALMGSRFNMKGGCSRGYATMKESLREKLRALAITPEAIARAAAQARLQDNSKRVKPTKHSNTLRSESLKGRVYTCPHCGKQGGGGLLRWHFDRCKLRKI